MSRKRRAFASLRRDLGNLSPGSQREEQLLQRALRTVNFLSPAATRRKSRAPGAPKKGRRSAARGTKKRRRKKRKRTKRRRRRKRGG